MHPEADAFLGAIFDNPDDDTPRLVYADWLQEHDQEDYAHFIRLSIQMGSAQSPAEWKQLNSKRRPFWKRMLAVRHDAYHHIPVPQHGYERGICNAVTVHGDAFLRTVESWWPAITPRELTVYGMRGFGTRGIETEIVAAVGRYLPWLRVLRCQSRPDKSVQDNDEDNYPPFTGSVFATLAAPSFLSRLRSLNVTIAWEDRQALRAFAESEMAARLDVLSVNICAPVTELYSHITVQEKAESGAVRHALESFLARHG